MKWIQFDRWRDFENIVRIWIWYVPKLIYYCFELSGATARGFILKYVSKYLHRWTYRFATENSKEISEKYYSNYSSQDNHVIFIVHDLFVVDVRNFFKIKNFKRSQFQMFSLLTNYKTYLDESETLIAQLKIANICFFFVFSFYI